MRNLRLLPLALLALRLETLRDARPVGKDRIFGLLRFAAIVIVGVWRLFAAGLDRHDLGVGGGFDGLLSQVGVGHQSCAPL
jgi:hypothetical protein